MTSAKRGVGGDIHENNEAFALVYWEREESSVSRSEKSCIRTRALIGDRLFLRSRGGVVTQELGGAGESRETQYPSPTLRRVFPENSGNLRIGPRRRPFDVWHFDEVILYGNSRRHSRSPRYPGQEPLFNTRSTFSRSRRREESSKYKNEVARKWTF